MRWKNIFLVMVIGFISTACRQESTPAPPLCPVENLLLDESEFPKGFSRRLPSKDIAPMRFGRDKVGVGFDNLKGQSAMQDVYLGSSVNETSRQFDDFVDTEFWPREGWTEWSIPDSFNYSSPVADQYRLGCRKHVEGGVEVCQAIGQYGPYLVRLYTDVSSVLTYEDVERLLQAIDERAAECLRG